MPPYLIIYDGLCNLCSAGVQAVYALDQGRLFAYLPMQDETALATWGITPSTCAQGMILLDTRNPDQRWQGSTAVEQLATLVPGMATWVEAYRGMTGLKSWGDAGYAQIRDHRYEWFGRRATVYRVDSP
jgi:predicted DCC family thiol-disulfide oxidoreductase YuxK